MTASNNSLVKAAVANLFVASVSLSLSPCWKLVCLSPWNCLTVSGSFFPLTSSYLHNVSMQVSWPKAPQISLWKNVCLTSWVYTIVWCIHRLSYCTTQVCQYSDCLSHCGDSSTLGALYSICGLSTRLPSVCLPIFFPPSFPNSPSFYASFHIFLSLPTPLPPCLSP